MNTKNVLGTELVPCSYDPITGYFRDGCCTTDNSDAGSHLVCVKVTQEFLTFSSARGNNLVTPQPQHRFAGLKAGDRWCLCAPIAGGKHWRQALRRQSFWRPPISAPLNLSPWHNWKNTGFRAQFISTAFHGSFAPRQGRVTAIIMSFAEGWMSGLSHTPGKRAWGYTHRGFESRLFRQRHSKHGA